MADRDHEKVGAWEFVEPVWFLMIMILISKSGASYFWQVEQPLTLVLGSTDIASAVQSVHPLILLSMNIMALNE